MSDIVPWVEKYRPKKIEDLLVNEMTMNFLKSILEKGCMPNTIFTGVPGVGKTTTVKCLIRQLFGHNYKKAVRILSTFDDRGIRIKETISAFCQSKLILKDENDKEIKHFYKVIFLDEVDNMTDKAQQSVAELMEKYRDTVRFVFTCNDSEKITNIQQKCTIIRYSDISHDHIVKRLEEICKLEDVKYNMDGLNIIAQIANGDMRQALNNLEIVGTNYGIINEDNVLQICDIPRPEDVRKLLKHCYNKDRKKAYNIYLQLKNKGHSNIDILNSIRNQLKELNFSKDYEIAFMKITSSTMMILNKGINTPIQLSAYFYRICNINIK